jgi:outer membrane protein assembly factor BamB
VNSYQSSAISVLIVLLTGVASGVDYPQWRGADGSGATPDVGVKCVEDLSQMKLVWESEAYLPDSYDNQYRGKQDEPDGGFTAHSLYDGKLYVQYSVPAGDLQDKNRLEAFPESPHAKNFSKVWADDVILCMDAKAGRTLWKRTYAMKGCHAFRLLGLVHTQPAIQDGKVYAVGSLGRVYCLDAKTGDPVWETTVGPGHEWAVKAIEKWAADQAKGEGEKYVRDNRTIKVLGKNDHGTLFTTLMPQLAGDVLVVNTGYQGDLAAFDLKTGKQRWYRAGVAAQKQSPTVWRSGDKYYVLHASGNGNEHGALVCTDAATGERAWLAKDAPTAGELGPVVSGPYIVVQGSARCGKGGTPLSCFRADGKGATKVWSMPPDLAPDCPSKQRSWCAPVIYRNHVYMRSDSPDGATPIIFACIELETGKVKGVIKSTHSATYCSMMAADGRIVTDWEVLDADPENFRLLLKPGDYAKVKAGTPFNAKIGGDALAMFNAQGDIQRRDGSITKSVIRPVRTFQTNVLGGGFYYWRGAHHIYCYDFRAPEARK